MWHFSTILFFLQKKQKMYFVQNNLIKNWCSVNIHWKNIELFWQLFNHMKWIRFLLKIRKSFCIYVVFFFPDDNITQVDTQQYSNQNKMEKLIYCSFFASETHFDSNLKSVIFFSFSLFFFIRPKKHLQIAETNCFVMCSLFRWVFVEFFIEFSFLFTEREK